MDVFSGGPVGFRPLDELQSFSNCVVVDFFAMLSLFLFYLRLLCCRGSSEARLAVINVQDVERCPEQVQGLTESPGNSLEM